MKGLSVAIVCKNNAHTIARVLDACRPLIEHGGEIVALDSGSTDTTLDLLADHHARVIATPWLGHVATKQKALDAAQREWVLCLDSDEPPDTDLQRAILDALDRDDPRVGGYRVNRKVWYRGRYLQHAWQPEPRLRLVRKGKARWAGDDPHDRLELTDPALRVDDLPGTLRHESFATFAEHLAKQAAHARVGAQSMHSAGRRTNAWRLTTSPIGAFLKQIVAKGAWRDGYAGWLAAGSTAAGTLMKHMILLELQNAPPSPGRPPDPPPPAESHP
ncbi:MAG: glycosyltransferase family 2 protein [Phycisphaeraceae bacterium]|nr:MAG: glycosyltransferase family 2 protein [Phycisphaeraceae bacterium]